VFVNGGVVQHDEAGAHYVAMIDQTTRGHRWDWGWVWGWVVGLEVGLGWVGAGGLGLGSGGIQCGRGELGVGI